MAEKSKSEMHLEFMGGSSGSSPALLVTRFRMKHTRQQSVWGKAACFFFLSDGLGVRWDSEDLELSVPQAGCREGSDPCLLGAMGECREPSGFLRLEEKIGLARNFFRVFPLHRMDVTSWKLDRVQSSLCAGWVCGVCHRSRSRVIWVKPSPWTPESLAIK